jgi:hypothetical protein
MVLWMRILFIIYTKKHFFSLTQNASILDNMKGAKNEIFPFWVFPPREPPYADLVPWLALWSQFQASISQKKSHPPGGSLGVQDKQRSRSNLLLLSRGLTSFNVGYYPKPVISTYVWIYPNLKEERNIIFSQKRERQRTLLKNKTFSFFGWKWHDLIVTFGNAG